MTSETTMIESERRRHSRFGRNASIRYRCFEDLSQASEAKRGELCDFSGGGARFLADQEFEKNSQLILELEFPGWQEEGDEWHHTGAPTDIGKLQAIGAVMWCARDTADHRRFEVGIRFIGRIR